MGCRAPGKIEAGGLKFLGEGDHVRGDVKLPCLVRPHVPRGDEPCLNLVDDEGHLVLLRHAPKLPEEACRCVPVSCDVRVSEQGQSMLPAPADACLSPVVYEYQNKATAAAGTRPLAHASVNTRPTEYRPANIV